MLMGGNARRSGDTPQRSRQGHRRSSAGDRERGQLPREDPTPAELKQLGSEDPSYTTPGDVSRTIALGANICLGSLRAKAVDELQLRGGPTSRIPYSAILVCLP